jgi:DUF2924 family protein
MALPEEIEILRRLDVPDLLARYREVFAKEPRSKNRSYLWKRIAWKLEEQRLGGLSQVARDRLEELIQQIEVPKDEDGGRGVKRRPPTVPPPKNNLAVGTTITRVWHGQAVQAKVLEDGFEHDGKVHKSLSAVAKAITGAHWNGRLFFGLTARQRRA